MLQRFSFAGDGQLACQGKWRFAACVRPGFESRSLPAPDRSKRDSCRILVMLDQLQ
jgi:hypothetical protein